jgi:tetratricopeptide (TPR) repeat protein
MLNRRARWTPRGRYLAPWILCVLLAGCSGIEQRKQPAEALIKPPASADEAVAVASELASRGRWSEAMSYLDSVGESVDADDNLQRERELLQAKWEREERALEDQILVGDAESLKNKIDLLERLSRAQPDDLVVTSRRIYWRKALASNAEELVSCAEVHVADRPDLAKRCFDIVAWLPAEESIERRLALVDQQLRTIASVNAERRRANEERERQARAKVLLNNAKASIEAHDFRTALDTLDELNRLQPENAEVAGLKEEALAMISPQIEALIKLGDHLYLDEQLEAAVATWQAALTLKPQDEEIQARIERAKTVIGKLERLRERQHEARPGPPVQ